MKQLYTHNSSVAWLTLSFWNVGNRNPWFYQMKCVNECKFNSTHTHNNIISMLHQNSEHSARFCQWPIHYTNSKLDTIQTGILHIVMFWDVAPCSAVQGTSTYECMASQSNTHPLLSLEKTSIWYKVLGLCLFPHHSSKRYFYSFSYICGNKMVQTQNVPQSKPLIWYDNNERRRQLRFLSPSLTFQLYCN